MKVAKDILTYINGESKRITKILHGNNVENEVLYQYHANDILIANGRNYLYKLENENLVKINIPNIINGSSTYTCTEIKHIAYTNNTYYIVAYTEEVGSIISYSKNLKNWYFLYECQEYPLEFFACSKNNTLVIGCSGSVKSYLLTFKNNQLVNLVCNEDCDCLTGLCSNKECFIYAIARGEVYYSYDGIVWNNVDTFSKMRILGVYHRKKNFYIFGTKVMYILNIEKNHNIIVQAERPYTDFTIYSLAKTVHVTANDDVILISFEDYTNSSNTGYTYYTENNGKHWHLYNNKKNDITYNEKDNLFYLLTYDTLTNKPTYIKIFSYPGISTKTLTFPIQGRVNDWKIIYTMNNH